MRAVRRYLLPAAIGLLSALLGVGAMTLARHLWQDHLALHELAVIEMQRLKARTDADQQERKGF